MQADVLPYNSILTFIIIQTYATSFQRLFPDLLRLLIYSLGSTLILVCYLMTLYQITCHLALDYARGRKNGNGCGKNEECWDTKTLLRHRP
jgi:uncharacterized membrane protein (GlpM family)